MDKIPDTTKDLWLPQLESGTLKQVAGKLRDGDTEAEAGYCCLGVLALACGARFFREEHEREDDEGGVYTEQDDEFTVELDGHDLNDSELLAQDWATAKGLTSAHQQLLSSLNDGGEHSIRDDDPLIEVWRSLSHTSKVSGIPGQTRFWFHKHTFAEIAQIIRERL